VAFEFRWTLADFKSDAPSLLGFAPSAHLAKCALVKAIRREGGFRSGLHAAVRRPSGGGWLARPNGKTGFTWEEFGGDCG
jgi:hypothetical protein